MTGFVNYYLYNFNSNIMTDSNPFFKREAEYLN